jgi:caa(3)-type oxidase subunit IV
MSSKDMSHHISHYRTVFFYLIIGTAITVGAAYLDFNVENSMAGAIFVGLAIASVKGYLVAANFMHLKGEKPMINWTLILTVFFLILLLFIPLLWDLNNMSNKSDHPIWDDINIGYNQENH